MDFKRSIAEIEKIIGYTFKDKSLLKQAFTRTSYCNEQNVFGKNDIASNEVLEFFGDSILSAVIVTFLMKDNTERYAYGIKTRFTEGDYSKIKSSLADKSNLSASISKLGLEKYLIMGEGDKKVNIGNEPSVKEDLFESIIGAVYIDSDMDITTAGRCVAKMLDTAVYVTGTAPASNAKGELQEWCADKSRRLPAPIYKTLKEEGPDHKKVFLRGCYIGGKLYGTGEGKNQKAADTEAAATALKALKNEKTKAPRAKQDVDHHGKLRKYAADNKLLPPEFHDLGETESSTDYAPEFKIECVCGKESVTAVARSKREARTEAAKALLEKLTKKKSTEQKRAVKAPVKKPRNPAKK